MKRFNPKLNCNLQYASLTLLTGFEEIFRVNLSGGRLFVILQMIWLVRHVFQRMFLTMHSIFYKNLCKQKISIYVQTQGVSVLGLVSLQKLINKILLNIICFIPGPWIQECSLNNHLKVETLLDKKLWSLESRDNIHYS